MSEKPNPFQVIKEGVYSVNYIYYGAYLFLLLSLAALHVLLVPSFVEGSRVVYLFCACLEGAMEVSLLALISAFLSQRAYRKTHLLFLSFTVLLLACHTIDLFLVRLMDLSIWEGMGIMWEESLENFIQILRATNLPLSVFIVGALAGGFALALVVSFFFASERWCKKKPLSCTFSSLFGVFVLGSSLLVCSDIVLHFSDEPRGYFEYAKALPWKRTVVMPGQESFSLGRYLKATPMDPLFQEADSSLFSLERKPDLFFFMVESLREDFLTEEVAPNLSSFRGEAASFPKTLSVANATHISWFSTFYSLYPFYWSYYRSSNWTQGSPVLRLLKKMGYEIHVYTGSSLEFYSMKRVLFGKEGELVDSLKEFRSDSSASVYASDEQVIEQIKLDLDSSEKKGGRVFLVFLDSTHFDYSWPKESTLFAPVEEPINYLKLACVRDDLSGIKNRYKNAIHHIDDLFGRFRLFLQEKGLWDEAFVAFTADHGEEFNEHGHMFHASALCLPQLKVPLYLKLGSSYGGPLSFVRDQSASQIDIFPTFFHYVVGEDVASAFFQGKSLFVFDPRCCIIGGRYNANRAPYQFYVQNDSYRMVAEFCRSKDVFHCDTIRVQSIEDENGEKVPFTPSFVQTHFYPAFDRLFGE